MGLAAQKNRAVRKSSLSSDRRLSSAIKSIKFWHEAAGGESSIDLSSLTLPSSVNGSNPSSAVLNSLNLFTLRNNLEVVSSSKGRLMDHISFSPRNGIINFVGFTADPGEIFECTFTPVKVSSSTIVDAQPHVVTGTLLAGEDQIDFGQAFQLGDTTQKMGTIQVFLGNPKSLLTRNTGNSSTTLDEDYYEIPLGDGTARIIQLNSPVVSDTEYIVTTIGAVSEKPTVSMLQAIESVAGQVDAMIPDLAAVSGNPESNYQAAPNSVDLKAFGSRMTTAEGEIDALQALNLTSGTWTPTMTDASNTTARSAFICNYLRVGDMVTVSGRIRLSWTVTSGLVEAIGTLPIASNLTDVSSAAGTMSGAGSKEVPGRVFADTSNNQLKFAFNAALAAVSGTNVDFMFSATYRIQ